MKYDRKNSRNTRESLECGLEYLEPIGFEYPPYKFLSGVRALHSVTIFGKYYRITVKLVFIYRYGLLT